MSEVDDKPNDGLIFAGDAFHMGVKTCTGVIMPTLFRFLVVLTAIAGIIYGSMIALVALVEPREREVTVRIPSERLNPSAP